MIQRFMMALFLTLAFSSGGRAQAPADDLRQLIARSSPEQIQALVGRPGFGTSDWAIQNGTGMLHFFTAVAVTEFGACLAKKDPLICTSFLESLKSPGTYLGFALFSEMAHRTSALVGKRSPFFGGAMGMAVGMMSNELFADVYGDPRVHAMLMDHRLLEKDPTAWWNKKAKLMSEICMEKYCNWNWYKDRSGSFASMLAGSVLGNAAIGMGVPTLLDFRVRSLERSAEAASKAKNIIRANQIQSKALKLIQMRKTFQNAMDIRRLPNIWTAAKAIYNGSKTATMNPLAILGWAVAEDLVMLFSTHVFDNYVMKHWNTMHRSRSLIDEVGSLMVNGRSYPFFEAKNMVVRPEILANPGWLDIQASKIKSRWEDVRQVQYHNLMLIQQRYSEVTKSEQDLDRLTAHYAWLINGQDPNFLVSDEFGDKYTPMPRDLYPYLESFFCGRLPQEAVYTPWAINGTRLPLAGEIEIRPFQLDFSHAPADVKALVGRACRLSTQDVTIAPDTNPTVREMRREQIVAFRLNVLAQIIAIVAKETTVAIREKRSVGFSLKTAYAKANDTVSRLLARETAPLRADYYQRSKEATLAAMFPPAPVPQGDLSHIPEKRRWLYREEPDLEMLNSIRAGVAPLIEQEARFWGYLSQLYPDNDNQVFIKASYAAQKKSKVLQEVKGLIENPPDMKDLRNKVNAYLDSNGRKSEREEFNKLMDISFGEVEKPQEKVDWEMFSRRLEKILLIDKRVLPKESLLN